VEELGIGRGTGTFRHALTAVAYTHEDVLAERMRLLHNIGFSKDDVLTIVRKQPLVLGLSEQKLKGNLDFLMKDVGLEVSYIVQRPVLLKYSVDRRLLPRHCLIKVLKEKGLLKGKLDYYLTAAMAEKDFVEKFVRPFKNHVPGLTDDYASKCLGEATVA
jgi:mTERF domain-containing protein